MPAPSPSIGRRTPYHLIEPEVKIANIQEELKYITSVPSNKHLLKNPRTPYKGKPIAETWLNMLMSRVITNEKEIAKVWLILDSFLHIYRLIGLSLLYCVTGRTLYLRL
jgi:hypothetical protein